MKMIEQVQNPIHFKTVDGNKLEAFIKASETFTICCGRNIAFISELPTATKSLEGKEEENGEGDEEAEQNDNSTNSGVGELLALTWIDPVTTEVVTPPVSTTSTNTSTSRRLSHDEGNVVKNKERPKESNINMKKNNSNDNNVIDLMPVKENVHRFLKGKKKSHVHGTNGYMLPLHSTSELMGIAHFHRPEGRDSSDYAKHGHHYSTYHLSYNFFSFSLGFISYVPSYLNTCFLFDNELKKLQLQLLHYN